MSRDEIDSCDIFSLFNNSRRRLDLESTGSTTTTCLLELTSLGADIRLDVLVGVGVVDSNVVSKVRVLSAWSTKKDSVRSLGRTECQLIESQAFSTSRRDTLSGILREGKCAHRHLWALQHADIVGDLSNNNSSLAFLLGHVL